ncbi:MULTISPECIES: PEPxxWA-CTERM sorting domain-containing protein [Sphingomonas]|uniref:PEPxxWA-CTERM sorting domain-containing protein n=1 Tax=Sphingomonas TaxID=13687 RepID=UPI000DEF1B26|nr:MULTISPECIES: PEPxxWA-CTERM sorting domain-containing protein [Sphingomonas]
MNALVRKAAIGAVFAIAAFAATPASATVEVGSNVGCSTAPVAPPADKCAGYFTGNTFNNSGASVAQQQSAIDSLIGAGNYTVNYNALVSAGNVFSTSTDANAFAHLQTALASLSGNVILGIHWGNVPESGNIPYGNVSGVYLWNSATLGTLNLTSSSGFSDAVIYRATPAVPEPATWALMLMGFGGMGVAMRRRRSANALPQMA